MADVETIHQTIYRHVHKSLELSKVGDDVIGPLWAATEQAAKEVADRVCRPPQPQNLALEALTWAICATAKGAGPGLCDPTHCVCGGDAKGHLEELRKAGWELTRVPAANVKLTPPTADEQAHLDSLPRDVGPSLEDMHRVLGGPAEHVDAPRASFPAGTERQWCTACGTVTSDGECHCTEPGSLGAGSQNLVNYADAMQKAAHEQAQEVARLSNLVEESRARFVEIAKIGASKHAADHAVRMGNIAHAAALALPSTELRHG